MSGVLRLPGPTRGLSIGLFGGSFNPAHDGHMHVAQTALMQGRLDYVWWIVAVGNPLKQTHGDFNARLASASAKVAGHPRMRVTDIEQRAGVRYSADLLNILLPRAAGTKFVWVMGADNLAVFHKWRDWRGIAGRVPLAVVARPGAGMAALSSPMARQYRGARIDAAQLSRASAPAWAYLTAPLHPHSSTHLRAGHAT